MLLSDPLNVLIFFFNDTATTEIYTLSLHDALPISRRPPPPAGRRPSPGKRDHTCCRPAAWASPGEYRPAGSRGYRGRPEGDRKSTRLNSSHANISYAVFCLKKKKEILLCYQVLFVS